MVIKVNRKFLIAGGVSCLLLVTVIAVVLLFVVPNIDVNSFKEYIKNRDYRAAYEAYEELSAEDQTKANRWLREYVENVEDKYYDGSLDYLTATNILEEMLEYEASYDNVVEAAQNIYFDSVSASMLEAAKELAENKNWREAYLALNGIDIKYRLYDEVKKLRDEYRTNYRAEVLSEFEKYAQSGEVDKLVVTKNNALEILQNDMEIIEICQQHLDNYVSNVLEDAAAFAEADDYESAIRLLDTANNLYEHQSFSDVLYTYTYEYAEKTLEALAAQNDLLTAVKYAKELAAQDASYGDLLTKYGQLLIDDTLSVAKSHAEKRQFEQAIQAIQTVQYTYDCSEFQNAITEYSKYLPILLTDCYVVDDSGNIESGDWTDSFGTKHKDSLRISNYSGTQYIIYNLDKRYVELIGTINYAKGSDPLVVNIYIDEKLVYTSPEIKKTSQTINIAIDVSNAQLLRIEFVIIDNSPYAVGGCIVDAKLS